MSFRSSIRLMAAVLCLGWSLQFAHAQDAKPAGESAKVEFGGGKVVFTPTTEWKSVPPKNNVIAAEFTAPANEEKAEKRARVTFSSAQGSVEANIDRWYAQFVQPDGSSTKDKSKVEVIEVQGQKVHMVDIKGTYKDGGGAPFAPQANPVMRENYGMLGAVVETTKYGKIFVKVTGPAETLEKLKDGFRKTLESMEVQK